MDYYKILDINKNASTAEIKIAFKKKAMIHHPDRNGDPEKFKEINEAHETLSDPQKRTIYDNPPQQNIFDAHNGIPDIFKNNGFGNAFGFNVDNLFSMHMRNNTPNQPRTLSTIIHISLQELYSGISKNIDFVIDNECPNCMILCPSCKGQRMVKNLEQTQFGTRMSIIQCTNCNIHGKTISKNKCSSCNNKRIVETKEQIPFFVHPGIPDNHAINIRFTKNNEHYILAVKFNITYDAYIRSNQDLILQFDIPFIKVITGQTNNIILPDGTKTIIDSLDFNQIIKHNELYLTKFNGLPFASQNGKQIIKYGQLFIKYNIVCPKINIQNVKIDKDIIETFLTKYIVA